MLTYTDHETLRLLVEQRREDLRRSVLESQALAARLARASRRSAGAARVLPMRPSKRPA